MYTVNTEFVIVPHFNDECEFNSRLQVCQNAHTHTISAFIRNITLQTHLKCHFLLYLQKFQICFLTSVINILDMVNMDSVLTILHVILHVSKNSSKLEGIKENEDARIKLK